MSLYRAPLAQRLWVKFATTSLNRWASTAALAFGLLVTATGLAQAQSIATLQLEMGNPSGATTDTSNTTNYLMRKPQYAMSYNKSHATPNWVSWHLGPEDIGSTGRSGTFKPDTTLPAGWYEVTTNDYTNGGYDRGHNCPSGDRTLTTTDNQATFLMSNVVPQEADNNQGPWEVFETYCRSLATAGNELFIISCPNTYNRVTIAAGKVYVPRFMSKIVVVLPKGSSLSPSSVTTSTRVICVDMPNVSGIRNVDWKTYRTSVDNVESYTGYDFLSEVDPAVQAVIEARVDNQ